MDNSFGAWWKIYPRRVKKIDAMKAWSKIPASEHQKILASMPAHLRHFNYEDGGNYIPHPATWLRAEQWNDELEVDPVEPPKLSCVWPGCGNDVVMGAKATGHGNACYDHLDAIKRGECKLREAS